MVSGIASMTMTVPLRSGFSAMVPARRRRSGIGPGRGQAGDADGQGCRKGE